MNLTLPIGIQHEGSLLREFTLSRPRGGLRAELQDAPNHVPGFDLVALRHVIRSLGPIIGPNDQILRRLTLPDRDYIHAACTEARYKGVIPIKLKCACDEQIEDEVIAANIELKPGKGDPQFHNGRACYPVEFDDPSTGQHVTILAAVPNIGTELRYAERRAELLAQKKPPGEADLERLADSIVLWNGEKGPTARVLRDMDLDAFDALTIAMNELDPPRLDDEAVTICSACSREHTVPVQFDWWLLPFAPQKGAKS